MEFVSIACVTHGRPDLAVRCLQSCVEQNHPNKEIILLLNPADDKTESRIRSCFPDIKILKTGKNIGFFPALNRVIEKCSGDFVMIVDDDAWFLSPDSLTKLLQHFREEPDLGAVTCTLEGPDEPPASGSDRYIRAFTTGFTMLPRKVMTDWIGPVPELFFRSAGETFWCTQLWEQQRPVKRVADARMFHALAEQGRSITDWRFYGLRSQLLCAVMREPTMWLGPVLISKLIKSFGQYIRYRQIALWAKAWLSFIFHLPDAIRQRKPISVETRRLLRRLDKSPVSDLNQLPEWRKLGEKRTMFAASEAS